VKTALVFLSILSVVSPLRAQLVADGATATLANVTTNITGTVIVGTNGSFTLLELSDNASLVNTLRGVIGQSATAKSNEVRFISPTARWQPGTTLFVGSNGSFNRLVISNGAQVIGNFAGNTGIIGQDTGSISNLALVTGAGSLWSNAGNLTVGFSGPGNQLVVSNGARVHSVNQSYVGLGGSSANNRVTVSGAGSLWSSDGAINLGLNGSGNRLSVLNGGAVRDGGGFIGEGAGGFNLAEVSGPGTSWTNTSEFHVGSGSSANQLTVSNGAVVFAGSLGVIGTQSGASLNTVTVTDPGSMWVNGGELYVGRDGPRNQLFVNNGGTVTASNLFIGVQPSSTNNRVQVAGGTLRVANAAGTSVLDVRRGTNVLNAGLVDVDQLRLTNGPGKFEFNGGTLITRGAFIQNDANFIVGAAGTNPAVWDVRAGETATILDEIIVVGGGTSFNQLILTNDSFLLSSGLAEIGRNVAANSNSAVIAGSSGWQLGGMVVGNFGSGNRLVVTNGALLLTADVSYIGLENTSSNNKATVSGAGSTWALASGKPFFVGYTRSGNQLIVSDGGSVIGFSASIGDGAAAINNRAVVTGAGSLWTNASEMYVGYAGDGNQLVISNGGTVFVQASRFIGYDIGSASNSVTVTGPGSRWLGDGSLHVGVDGVLSRLLVRNGGQVFSGFVTIGTSGIGNSNQAVVMDAGSLWDNQSDLTVGFGGSANQLVISNGGAVNSARHGFIGFSIGGSLNSVLVTGPGSTWQINSNLSVGRSGALCNLIISNGASVFTGGLAMLGADTNAAHNVALVTDPGSSWLINSNLFVGSNGALCNLVISNGARVDGLSAFIGGGSPSSNNLAVVTGPGSTWNCADLLHVGSRGAGNQLLVTNGAQVINRSMSLGFNSSSSNNLVLVRGGGTLLTNSDVFNLGLSGGRNRMTVEEGARVESADLTIGGFGTSSGNEVVVSGLDSIWRVESDFVVGQSGSGNRLVITNAGRLRSNGGSLGLGTFSTNNEVLLTGAGSIWTNTSFTQLGQSGSGNRLTIRDGAELRQEHLGVTMGVTSSSTNNRLVVDGGSLRLLDGNPILGAVLDIRRGTNVLNAGLIETGSLLLTNSLGAFEFNGGTLLTRFATVNNTRPFVVGASGTTPALWSMIGTGAHVFGSSLNIGGSASQSRLLVTNGAILSSVEGALGSASHFNHALISGFGSRWDSIGDFAVGIAGSTNSLVVSNGGQMTIEFPLIGAETSSSNNQVLITGPGSRWIVRDALLVGASGPANQLLIADNALVTVSNTVIVGATPATSRNNRLHIPNGQLFVNNAAATGTLDIRHGTNRLDAGLVDVDRLRVTNSAGAFELNGGTLSTRAATIANGRPFTVGNGASEALLLSRGGTNFFANNLVIARNGLLQTYGEITGTLIVSAGGRLTPGAPFEPLNVVGSVILQGRTDMVIRKNGTNLLNNLVTATGGITYGGDLIVTKLGTDEPAAGDRFRFFNATVLAGSFLSILLPPLSPGLNWTNKLLVDGSIEVIGVAQPGFSSIGRAGTNLVFSGTNGTPGASYAILTATNVGLPGSNWVSLVTNQFGAGGQFSFTNAIIPGELERYFRLRSP